MSCPVSRSCNSPAVKYFPACSEISSVQAKLLCGDIDRLFSSHSSQIIYNSSECGTFFSAEEGLVPADHFVAVEKRCDIFVFMKEKERWDTE